MIRCAPFLLTLLVCLSGCAPAQRVMGDATSLLPGEGEVEGLTRTAKPVYYRGESDHARVLGASAVLYRAYGADVVAVGEYAWGGPERRMTVEVTKCSDALGASGLFHRHRILFGEGGAPVRIGVDGFVDTSRGGRNLYCYQGNVFFKFLYTGSMPVPDLTTLARRSTERVGGFYAPPPAYDYLAVDGVDMATVGVTPGYTMNFDFLPSSVCALAPGAGAPEASAYVIVAHDVKAAERMERDHRDYLRLRGKDYDSVKSADGGRPVWWGVQLDAPKKKGGAPREQEVIATRKGTVLVFVTAAPSRRQGGELMDRVVGQIP